MDRVKNFLNDFTNFLQRVNNSKQNYLQDTWVTEYSCYKSFLDAQRMIIFYELRDFNRQPKCFHSVNEFFVFLKKYNISLPTYQENKILHQNQIVYSICKYGSPTLLLSENLNKLKETFNLNK